VNHENNTIVRRKMEKQKIGRRKKEEGKTEDGERKIEKGRLKKED
jgi:hypothetical protein